MALVKKGSENNSNKWNQEKASYCVLLKTKGRSMDLFIHAWTEVHLMEDLLVTDLEAR